MTSACPVMIVHLMADYTLTFNPLFFGQFALIDDLARRWHALRFCGHTYPVIHRFLGLRVTGSDGIRTLDPTRDTRAYVGPIAELCRNGQLVVVFSHFIHKDAKALAELARLKRSFGNLFLVVILHCTRDEFLCSGAELNAPRARQQVERAAAFRESMKFFREDNAVDRFVAVSNAARQSYLEGPKEIAIPPDRIETVVNGADPVCYRMVSAKGRARRRRQLGIAPGLVLGCTSRWTQAKGKDVLEALLDRLEERAGQFPATFLFPLLLHDQLFQFLNQLPRRYPRLYQAGRLRGFVDLSRLKRSVFSWDLEAVCKAYQQALAFQSEGVRQVWKQIAVGFLEEPVQELLDIYLRPSIAEAFGLGNAEAYLCGVPVLASDRGGCSELVLPRDQVAYDAALNLGGPSGDRAGYQTTVNQAADKFCRLLERCSERRVPDPTLRKRMIARRYTTRGMIQRYNQTVGKLLLDSGRLSPLRRAAP